MKNTLIWICLVILLPALTGQPAKPDIEVLKRAIVAYKADQRGPYKDIRWFCPDGRINDPKTPCNQEGAFQRARYKDEVDRFGKQHHIFLGQILMGTSKENFLDVSNYFSRMKQYQLEQYLQSIDNGWINEKAQFYRGAVQAEDEMAWGREFLLHMLGQQDLIENQFFITRRAVQTLPHGLDDQLKQRIRSVSKIISDEEPKFMPVRIKIHGNPQASDILASKNFIEANKNLNNATRQKIQDLIRDMEVLYAPLNYDQKIIDLSKSRLDSELKSDLTDVYRRLKTSQLDFSTFVALTDLLGGLREKIVATNNARTRLEMMDHSIELENILLNRFSEMNQAYLGELNATICQLASVTYATGLTEKWEWKKLEGQMASCHGDAFMLHDLMEFHREAKKSVEWSVNMFRSHYNPVINLFAAFEPLSNGFMDDMIRSSVLLPLGQKIGHLGQWLNEELDFRNEIEGVSKASGFRGLNPGYAFGELEVISGSAEDLDIDKSKIYVFDHPPSDLKPVAGIFTVSEGNPVSHIQLLARNLGIPNTVVGKDDFARLQRLNGSKVFYAVSPKGTVVLKSARTMTREESALFTTVERAQTKINVPTDRLKLDIQTPIDMKTLDKASSGIVCGPKAANLAELKKHFPEHVVEGIVIPFGVFKAHMDQSIPGRNTTYWEFVEETFEVAKNKLKDGSSETEIERYQLDRLEILREMIKVMPFLSTFERDLERSFQSVLNTPLGKIPVFLRSDTNMEDLKDFTGAGLNLTLFNVLDKTKILQGIKDVWASPYTERSYKWRQKFLLNPENVYPSILIIPGVNVDYSGVLITKGLTSGVENDLTIAFNRGVGGAVDGQAAESYTLHVEGFNRLEAPAREATMRYLSDRGGTSTRYVDFAEAILSEEDLDEIRTLAKEARVKIDLGEDGGTEIVQDIEFGFLNHHIWLFQVRPFVENKQAQSSQYLISISPPDPENRILSYNTSIRTHYEN